MIFIVYHTSLARVNEISIVSIYLEFNISKKQED